MYSAANEAYDRAEALQDTLIGRADSVIVKTALITGADQLYAHHFALLAEHFSNPEDAYGVVEQARGRAVADLLFAIIFLLFTSKYALLLLRKL